MSECLWRQWSAHSAHLSSKIAATQTGDSQCATVVAYLYIALLGGLSTHSTLLYLPASILTQQLWQSAKSIRFIRPARSVASAACEFNCLANFSQFVVVTAAWWTFCSLVHADFPPFHSGNWVPPRWCLTRAANCPSHLLPLSCAINSNLTELTSANCTVQHWLALSVSQSALAFLFANTVAPFGGVVCQCGDNWVYLSLFACISAFCCLPPRQCDHSAANLIRAAVDWVTRLLGDDDDDGDGDADVF